jgi:hypothetical protein
MGLLKTLGIFFSIPGKDYVANQVIVRLRPNISSSENERVLGLMGSIGDVKHIVLKASKLHFYIIQITNGMSVPAAIEKMETDPSVDHVNPDSIGHGLTPGNAIQ